MPAPLNPEATPAPAASQSPSEDRSYESAFSEAQTSQSAAPQQSSSPPAAPTPAAPQAPASPAAAAAPAQPQSSAPPAAAPAPQPSPLLAQARAAGLPLDGITTEAQLAQALLEQYQRVIPYVQIGQQFAPHITDFQSYLANRGQQPAQPAAPQEPEWSLDSYFDKAWDVPKWENTYDFAITNGLVQRDPESGLFVPTPGAEAMVAPILTGLNQAEAQIRQQRQQLFEGNPLRNIWDKFQEPIERIIEQRVEKLVGERFQQVEQTDFVDQFENANRSWLYDAAGQPTAQGQQFYNQIDALQQAGVTDPKTLISLAQRLAGVGVTPAAPASPAGGAPAPSPTAGAPAQPVTPEANSQAKKDTFLNRALANAAHQPQSQGHMQSNPDAPVVTGQGDLDQLFTNAFAQSKAAA